MTSPNDSLDYFLPYLLRRLTTMLNTDMQKDLKSFNINIPRWRVVAVLHFSGACSLGELTTRTALTQSGTSQVINQLVKEGIVERKVQADDGRILHLSLTKKGQDLFDHIFPIVLRHQDNLTTGFTDQEKKIFTHLCQRMIVNMEGL